MYYHRLSMCAALAGCTSLAPVAWPLYAQSQVEARAAVHAPAIDDMLRLRQFDELAVSPDGRWVAYATSARLDADTGDVQGRITLLDLRRHSVSVVTVEGGQPHMLEWSSSGNVLAFLSQLGGETRIWRYSLVEAGSEPETMAIRDSLDGEILAFAWGPTDEEIAYVAREPQMDSPAVKLKGDRPRLVLFNDSPGDYTGPTSPAYARDSTGAYVAVARVGGALTRVVARHLVSSKATPTLEWSRSGALLVGGPPIGVSYWSQITKWELYVIDPESAAVQPVRPQGRGLRGAAWSPSGQWIAYLDSKFLPQVRSVSSNYTLRVQDPATPAIRATFSAETDGLSLTFSPVWGADGNTIYIGRYQRGTARLFAIDLDSGHWRALTPDTLSVSHYAVSRDGKTLLAVLESVNQPQEIFRIDPATGALTQLTHGTNAFLASLRVGHVDQIEWPSSDGRFTVHGFLVKPPAFDSTRRYPLVVLVHGGPGALFTNSFIDVNFAPIYVPSQLLASAGYLVLLANPRGDPSYGKTFSEALHDDWGPGPFSDINTGLTALIEQGIVDSSAVGIAGASYGGYLTAYAITQTRRFAAASINDGPVDLTSEYGQNYATRASMAAGYFGGPPWTQRDLYASQSPITFVDRVRTPVLMRYGGRSMTGDEVRPSYMLAQGFEFYAGLRDTGVPVEFVLHPSQSHGITDWELYKDWIERNLRWFDFWLRHTGPYPTTGEHRQPSAVR